ncbi:MAG: energy-coupling factor transporter ATPase [Firmicutes bacterium]|nr:energy-coupling factor transporter ATPase [Bacillota bacterium]
MPVTIQDLKYVYSPNTPFAQAALSGVSLGIADGEFLGIIGHTGSGKSTLVLHLNGLIKLTGGSIVVDGIDLSKKYDYKKLRSTVGMVFQFPEYQLFDETVEKDVGFGPRNLGLSKEEIADRVRTAIEYVGLDFAEVKDRSPFELSGGQKRRAALAGVLAMRPKILVLDEPTAGLDPKGKSDILRLVKGLHKEGATVIMISHNMDEISEHCQRIAVMNKGALECVLPPSELFDGRERLRALSLDIPVAAEIAASLRARGVTVPPGIHKRAELVDYILKWKGAG